MPIFSGRSARYADGPTGYPERKQMAAKAFGRAQTFFATNGTSTAKQASSCKTLIAPAQIAPARIRNLHKSVHHGVGVSGARPIYLDSSCQSQVRGVRA